LLVEGKRSKNVAYKTAFNRPEMKPLTASKAAHRLCQRADVIAYIEELNSSLDRAAILSKEKRMVYLSRIITTSAGALKPTSDLCQSVSHAEDGSVKLTMPSKIAAITELNKMDGAYEPERHELKCDLSFSALLDSLHPSPLVQ